MAFKALREEFWTLCEQEGIKYSWQRVGSSISQHGFEF